MTSRKILAVAVALVAAATLTSAPALAANIDFNTLGGSNGDAFSTYTENGFTVSLQTGAYFVGTLFGNPVPDVFAGSLYGPAEDSLVITKVGGGMFEFDSADFASNNGTTAFAIIGQSGATQLYDFTGTVASNAGFFTENPGEGSVLVSSVVLDLNGAGTSFNVDNIVLTAPAVAPEPGSFALLGTGLLSAAGMLRRRLIR